MSSATPRPLFASLIAVVAAVLLLATSCGATATEITGPTAAPTSINDSTPPDVPEEEPTAEPVIEPTATPEPEPTEVPPEPTAVEEAPTPEPVAVERSIPGGWEDYDLGTFQAALPGAWTGLTTGADIDAMLDDATANVDGSPAELLEQYRSLVNGGDALIGLGSSGDNFNAFRQFGSAAALSDTDAVIVQLQQQLGTFADEVVVDAYLDSVNGRDGLRTNGSYNLQGQTVHLYQFATEVNSYLYYFTVTLFTGDDPALADDIFNSIGFE